MTQSEREAIINQTEKLKEENRLLRIGIVPMVLIILVMVGLGILIWKLNN